MNNTVTQTKPERAPDARQSFTGASLTESQYDTATNIVAIMHRNIEKNGTFREPLTDFAHAFARGEKFDAMRGETIIRDLFKAINGETMNQLRTRRMDREATLRETGSEQALYHANRVLSGIQDSPTMPFYQAYDQSAVAMAQRHGITETGAKSMMKEVFEATEGRDLYEAGKEMEEQHHKPVRDAQRAARKGEPRQMQRSGPQM